ncbi:MAG: glycosyltransferase family 4 protein [Bacteroidetes Order II. Incertae sedis bacterium]|nr:glycosyltransferase family 4 protein [Bacteroidetes Order II. bacterium]
MKNVLFVLRDLPWYYYSAINTFSKTSKVSIIVTKKDKDAPYSFLISPDIQIFQVDDTDKEQVLAIYDQLNPAMVVLGSWSGKVFRGVARRAKKDGKKTVIGVDNPWENTFKQDLLCLFSWFLIRRIFTYVWVPSISQYEYAKRLGFKRKNIIFGLYTADDTLFLIDEDDIAKKEKNILFIGRLLDWKGILELNNAFIRVSEEKEHDWKLIVIGNGPMKEQLKPHKKINFISFSPPEMIASYMKKSAVFCLPSWHEHFGVVVHEAAMAGCALLLSDGVHAGDEYLVDGYNGVLFASRDNTSLQQALSTLMFSQPIEEVIEMGKRSRILSMKNAPEIWANRLAKLLN